MTLAMIARVMVLLVWGGESAPGCSHLLPPGEDQRRFIVREPYDDVFTRNFP
jgi:hypothetical protein